MMRPENISLAEILVPTETFETAIDALYRFGAVELENKPLPGAEHLPFVVFKETMISQAKENLATLSHALEILDEKTIPRPSTPPWSKITERIQEDILTARAVVEAQIKLDEAKGRYAAACTAEALSVWLTSIGIEPNHCRSSERITVFTGTLPTAYRDIALSQEAISEMSSPEKGRCFIACALRKRDADAARDLLNKAGFAAVDPRPENESTAQMKTALDLAQLELQQYKCCAPRLAAAQIVLDNYLHATQEAQRARSTERCSYITCWLPSCRVAEFTHRLALLPGGCTLQILPAEHAIAENVFRDEEIPAILKRHAFLDPFRLIVAIYGHPAYRHVDPLVLSAFGFLVMFAVMFADIGHGAVIAIVGLLLHFLPRSHTLRDVGMLMIYSGIASAAGGFVFGSFFGREHVVPALWFSPMENTDLFLLLGVVSGLVMISAGILLNIVQKFWQGDTLGAFFSPWGILTLGFYWLCAAILGGVIRDGALPLPLSFLLAAVALPVIILVIGGAVIAAHHGKSEGAEIAFRPVEIVLGLLSNTVSFVRVSAFGLTHIALMTAVYLIASMTTGSALARQSIAVEGNIFVICLEGLIVTIQCLRLQFYEIYSKFFETTGRAFAPIRKTSIQGEVP